MRGRHNSSARLVRCSVMYIKIRRDAPQWRVAFVLVINLESITDWCVFKRIVATKGETAVQSAPLSTQSSLIFPSGIRYI
jgi:hypothetical protein